MVQLAAVGDVARRVYADFSAKNVTLMAAGIAYTAFVSLAPMLLLLLLVISVFGGGLESQLADAAGEWLPGPVADLVQQIFASDSVAGISVVGLVVLVWGTLKIFRGLDTAFSEIYETDRNNSIVDQLKDGVIVLVALLVAVLSTVGVSSLFALFDDAVPFLGYLTPLVLFLGLVLAFYPIFYYFPDTDLGYADVLPGVLFAALGWAVLQGFFQVYLLFKDPGTTDFLGSIIVVITYLYFSGLILLVGAVLNAAIGGHSSGAPGGVGRGAAGRDADRNLTLSGDELADYLDALREDLTGRYREMRPTSDRSANRPPPAGDVTVVESSSSSGETAKLTVTLRWPVSAEPDTDGDERPADADADGREPDAEGPKPDAERAGAPSNS